MPGPVETHLAPLSTHLGHGARSAAIQAAAKQALSASGALAAVEAAKLGADGQPLEEKKKREKKAPKYVKVDMLPINWWPVHRAARDLQRRFHHAAAPVARRPGLVISRYLDIRKRRPATTHTDTDTMLSACRRRGAM